MINDALRLARLHRIANFLVAVEGALTKPTKTRINRLKNYSVAIKASKSDEALEKLAEDCEMILDIMTDGNELTDEKIKLLRELHADILKAVS